MLIPARPIYGLLATLGYWAICYSAWTNLAVELPIASQSAGQVLAGIVIPVGLGAAFLVGVTNLFGWWTPAMFEAQRFAPRWTLAIPILMATIALVNIASVNYSAVSLTWIVALSAGAALTGFSAELSARGLALVGFRGRFSEIWSWVGSSLLLSWIGGATMLGYSRDASMSHVMEAFLTSSALYVARMAAGTLAAAMVLHAAWDFGMMGRSGSGADPTSLAFIGIPLWYLPLILAIIAAPVIALRVGRKGAILEALTAAAS